MLKLNKYQYLLLAIVICFGLTIGMAISAQENNTEPIKEEAEEETIEEVVLDETVNAQDLEVKEPKILPDNRFYFLKNWGRGLRLFFTFDKIKKTELESKFANERLIEIKKMVEKNKNPEIIKKATEKYEKRIERIKARTEKIKEKASKNQRVKKFLDKYTHQQILHQKLLEKLENQVRPEVFEKIKEAREKHLERFKDVMLKLEDKDKIPETLDRILEKEKGSDFRYLKQVELLKRLREKMPDEIKEKIKEKEEKRLERLKNRLEQLPEEKQEKFQKYIEKVPGDREKRLEVLENLREKLKNNPQLKEKLRKNRERVLEKIKERAEKIGCPEIQKPAPGFCEKGRIIIKRDEKGCVIDFKCLIPKKPISPVKPIPIPKPSPLSTSECNSLKTELDKLIKKSSYCAVDSDCANRNIGGCIGALYCGAGFVGNKSKIEEVEKRALEYENNCLKPCGLECPIWKTPNLVCENNKCVAKTSPAVTKPELCTALWNPVCGKNGKTYSNECFAKKAGVKIAHKGKCEISKQSICGNGKCETGEDPITCPKDCRNEFKNCQENLEFKCLPITQGAAPPPGKRAPIVCGCMPSQCPKGTSLVVSGGMGKWPDGTAKGTGTCSSVLPPSVGN